MTIETTKSVMFLDRLFSRTTAESMLIWKQDENAVTIDGEDQAKLNGYSLTNSELLK